MKKRIASILLIISMLIVTAMPVFAEPEQQEEQTELNDKGFVIDDADLFTTDGESFLNRVASRMFAAYGYDTVIYTCFASKDDDEPIKLNKAAQSFIDQHSEYNTGVLLIMRYSDELEMLPVRFGNAKKALNADAMESITNSINAADSYYKSAVVFQQRVQYYLNYSGVPSAFDINTKPLRLIDNADLLTNTEEEQLLTKLDEISERQRLDVIVVTQQSIGQAESRDYADDFYDYNGYGYGDNFDGILLLISMENRDWAISTCGAAINIFTDAGQGYITDKMMPYLKNGEYYNSFDEFAAQCDDFISHYYDSGKAYDIDNMPKGSMPVGLYTVISIVIGLVVGLITASVYKGQLTSVKSQQNADLYVRQGSVNISERSDIFLYHVINRRERPRDDSSHSGGGGSSSHSSSSGSSHGGSSGHF